jgi:hypothetical protein
MLETIATILIAVGFFSLVAVCAAGIAAWIEGKKIELTVTDHDPYRDGLEAAARISGAAFEAEQLLHQAGQQAEREAE